MASALRLTDLPLLLQVTDGVDDTDGQHGLQVEVVEPRRLLQHVEQRVLERLRLVLTAHRQLLCGQQGTSVSERVSVGMVLAHECHVGIHVPKPQHVIGGSSGSGSTVDPADPRLL